MSVTDQDNGSETLPHSGNALTEADTHGGYTKLTAFGLHDIQQRGGDTGTRATQRMAQGDRAAVQVNLLFHYTQQFQVFQNRQRLTSEGFVQLPEVDVFDLQACTLQRLLGGRYRTVTHDCGI